MSHPVRFLAILALAAVALPHAQWMAVAQSKAGNATPSHPERVLLDTDIGDDVDDAFAFALALLLHSRELKLEGVTTAWGNTTLRARLVRRMLKETGWSDVPVGVGVSTKTDSPFTQAAYAKRGPDPADPPKAVDFLLAQISAHPGEVTLIAIGPLTNIGAAIDRDAATFRKVKRVVLMGGSVRRRYGDLGYAPDRGPEVEYNIRCDIAAAQKLFRSGVPIFMMPLDSTQLKLDEVKRAILFSVGTPLTDALTLLYHEWGQQTPTLFDAMAVAYVVEPNLCPVTPLHIEVTNDGFTRETPGTPNASVCLNSDSEKFFRFALPRLMNETVP